jgi:hypothetical protein
VRRPLVFDNVSHVNNSQSDVLARIATGGEIIERKLYTNNSAHVTQMMRPVLLNGIFDGFARSDLASRAFAFNLSTFSAAERTPFSLLADLWRSDRCAVMAALCDLCVTVLERRMNEPVPACDFHRNADAVHIITIIEDQIGGDAVGAMRSGVEELAEAVLASSIVGTAIRAAADRCRKGRGLQSASVSFRDEMDFLDTKMDLGMLRMHLAAELGEIAARDLPKTPRGLGEMVARVEGELRTLEGIAVEKRRTRNGFEYTFRDLRHASTTDRY